MSSLDELLSRYPRLDRDIARVLALAPPQAPGQVSVEQLRARVKSGDASCAPGPDLLDIVDTVVPGTSVPVRRYLPHTHRSDVIVVWFHGGGWVSGDIGYSDAFCRLLAEGVGCEVRSVAYRLAPEQVFPAALDDARAAVQWATQHGPVVVAGDSAGGNLAAVCAREALTGARVAGQLLVYPVLDHDTSRDSYTRNDGLVLGADSMNWFFDCYIPDTAQRSTPQFAPLRAPVFTGLPPALVAVAGLDPLRDEGVAYVSALERARVPAQLIEFDSMVHGFLRYTGFSPGAADAAGRIVSAARGFVGQLAAAGVCR